MPTTPYSLWADAQLVVGELGDAVTESQERRAMISGIGLSEVGRHLKRHTLDLALDASCAAIADAGLLPTDIDGLATVAALDDTPANLVHDALGLSLTWQGMGNAVLEAVSAVAARYCRHVLVYRSVHMLPGTLAVGVNGGHLAAAGPWEYSIPFHLYSAASIFAMHMQRHMHDYGSTKEQLAWIPLTCRHHAGLNPAATMREPLTMEQYLAARRISDPLGLLDCDLPVDGAVAFVVSTVDYAPDAPRPGARFEAAGAANRGRLSWEQRLDYPSMAADDAAEQMWSRTDLKPTDVDLVELYDGFSFLTLSWLEALGFCGRGEGGEFIEGGERIRVGGELPLNTYGGQLSAGRLHGFWQFHEAVTQLRGDAGARQVANAEVAVTSAFGGPGGICTVLTRM